jgi:hypothetical protein
MVFVPSQYLRFNFSQSCYSPGALSYIIVLLIQMSMDERCEAIQHDIETAINCCLISYDQSAWRKEVNVSVIEYVRPFRYR